MANKYSPVRIPECHPDRKHFAHGLCESCNSKRKRLADPEKFRVRQRARSRRHNLKIYGLTVEDYDKMYRRQNGLCAICHNPPREGWPLFVDHDHETMQVRGLLCDFCNRGLGNFRDNVEFLAEAQIYLTNAKLNPLPCRDAPHLPLGASGNH